MYACCMVGFPYSQADLAFKQEEMEKSEATAKTLDVGQCHFCVTPNL